MDTKSKKISEFIIKNIESHSADLVSFIAENFNISRQRALVYINREVDNERIVKIGKTSSVRYFLVGGNHIEFSLKITPTLAEDSVWSKYVRSMVLRYSGNIQSICNYGFTEIFNNAIDHSSGSTIFTDIIIDKKNITITIMDNGIGIFKKIQNALNLEFIKESLLHLSKGKFTTDPSNHTGEGIFFTSRVFDSFSILSSDLFYTFSNKEWFISSEKEENIGKGTLIKMTLSLESKRTVKEIMDQYADQEIGFQKTIVAVALSSNPKDPHVSRSQAKRLLMGLEKFRIIVLDFKGIGLVGQAFVDEIFRVFQNEHPNIIIEYINTNQEVELMIKRGVATER